jgi:hypothetical protein
MRVVTATGNDGGWRGGRGRMASIGAIKILLFCFHHFSCSGSQLRECPLIPTNFLLCSRCVTHWLGLALRGYTYLKCKDIGVHKNNLIIPSFAHLFCKYPLMLYGVQGIVENTRTGHRSCLQEAFIELQAKNIYH